MLKAWGLQKEQKLQKGQKGILLAPFCPFCFFCSPGWPSRGFVKENLIITALQKPCDCKDKLLTHSGLANTIAVFVTR
ncbi:MAG: hypothetical protein ACREEM_01415 [Blastocatellia bacterium]